MISIIRAFIAPLLTSSMPAASEALVPLATGLQSKLHLTFEETVSQMSRGYENTQRVVQFMDAKAGAVVTLCLAIFVVAGKIVVGAHDRLGEGMLVSQKSPTNFMIWGMTILVVASGVFGFICLHHAFKAVRPNDLPHPDHFSTLFPAAEKPWTNAMLADYLQQVVNGQDREFLLNEFRQQLLAMGDILYRKIYGLRAAIRALWWQGLSTFLLLLFVGLVVGFGLYPNRAEQSVKPLPVTIIR
ncbi:MAG: hypothetical protein QM627_12305 [Luteolibacter sp.]